MDRLIFLSLNSRLRFSRCVDICVYETLHVLVIILLLKKEYFWIGYALLWNNVNKEWQAIILFKNCIPGKEWASSFCIVHPWKYVEVHTSFHSSRLLTLEVGFKPWPFNAPNLRHGMNLAITNASCWFFQFVTALQWRKEQPMTPTLHPSVNYLIWRHASICNPLWRHAINEILRTNRNCASSWGSATSCLIGIYE